MSELTEHSAHELARLVGERHISAREVASAFSEKIEKLNPVINAIITVNPHLLNDAAEVDSYLARGGSPRPLEGVPFVVKDNIPTRGIRTTYGSLIYENNLPKESAVLVQRLQAAGGILLGKTNLSEFATDINTTNKIFGMTRNPIDLNVSTGGSSGGTAAAIAANMTPVGIGTDLGGSIRIPAAWCGVSGVRPSPGRVPIYPTDFAWDTLVNHVQGPMARTVADLGLLLAVLAGQDDRDPISLPNPIQNYAAVAVDNADLRGKRIAYCRDLGGVVPVDPEVGAAAEAAARAFEDFGCVVEDATFDASDIKEIIAGTRGFGIVARFADLARQHGNKLTTQLTGQIEDALKQDLQTVAHAERLRTNYWHRVRMFQERYDFILTPTVGAPPFRLDQPLPTTVGDRHVEQYYDIFLFVYAFSLLGLPAASIPCGMTSKGLPISLQIVGRRLREDQVLMAAAAYERGYPEHFKPMPVDLSKAVKLQYDIVTPGMRSSVGSEAMFRRQNIKLA